MGEERHSNALALTNDLLSPRGDQTFKPVLSRGVGEVLGNIITGVELAEEH